MDTNTVEVTQAQDNVQETNVETPQTTEHVEKTQPADDGKVKSSEVLRELSKRFSVNLFEKDGLEQFIEKVNATETKALTLEERVTTVQKEYDTMTAKQQEYETKIEALSLGFTSESIDEVIALAKVNIKEGQTISDGLKVVKEKYGSVFGQRKGIGIQSNDVKSDKVDLPRSEQEAYLAKSPKYQQWTQKTKK